MGRRGPPPLPSAIKKSRGTFRPARSAKNEVTPPLEVPDVPPWLDAGARAVWSNVVPQLEKLRVLTALDRLALANYCAAQALAVRATIEYQREGLLPKAKAGSLMVRAHPLIKVAQEARAQALRIGIEFGLTPASRSRINAPAENEEPSDDAAGFFFQGPKLVPDPKQPS
jgi:P27 family predicted phage terminase small subunit